MSEDVGATTETKAFGQDRSLVSAPFDRSTLQSFGFWVLGILSVSAAFSYGLFADLPLGTQSMVGMDFILKQASVLGLQVSAALAFGKIVSGILLGLHWIPRISPRVHVAMRTVVFVVVSGVSMMILITLFAYDAFVVHFNYSEYPPLVYAFGTCIFFWIIVTYRAKRETSRWFSNGLAITFVGLAIWLSFALGQARLQKIITHKITICLTGGRTLFAAPITVNNGMLVLYQQGTKIFDGFQIGTWGAIPTNEIVMMLEQVEVGQGGSLLGCYNINEANTHIQLTSE